VPIARIGGIGVVAALVAVGAVAVPPSAFAAEPFPTSGLYATTTSSVVSVDRATGATTTVLPAPPGASGLNQIGISGDGSKLFLATSANVYEYTASSETWETTSRGATGVAVTMGGVDPKTGRFFFGGQVTGQNETFTFVSYDPATNALSTSNVRVTASDAPGGNGDLAFDGQGNLFFVASSTAGAQVYRVDGHDLDGGTATATKVGPEIEADLALNSMAFGDDGYLYIAGSGTDGFLQVNPITGEILERKTLTASITDLGSNALPTTGSVTLDLPERFKDGDQFTVEIGGGGITTGNTATTTGDEESAVLGPILLLPGGTYTIEQTPEPGTRAADYTTTWACTDPATGATIASGDGSSGEFTIPEGVKSVDCSFTNTVVPPPVADDDTSGDNTPGSPVTVDVVGNDAGGLDPTSVRLVDPDGGDATELTVEGEGTWTVDTATGRITFTPEEGYTGNPTPVEYTVKDGRGDTTQASVAVRYQPTAAEDASAGNAVGDAVTVRVVDNDSANLDPASVRLLDGAGDPVTELAVEGEGTWTVDPATGAITFTPQEGFIDSPTPVRYRADDGHGNTVTADLTVTYLPKAQADASVDNAPLGSPVTVDVLGNDSASIDPGSVRLVDGDGDPVTELVVDGEGTWTVDPDTGAITFTPEPGFTGNPTAVEYTADDGHGNETTSTITVAYTPAAADDVSTGNTLGDAVTVEVTGNDSANLDPTTVRLVDGDGNPVTELAVDGEGTWTVDTATGAITFSPEDGFTGDPTAVEYAAADGRGNAVTATVTVTYTPAAGDDSSYDNTLGETVAVPVAENDSANVDPTTVRLVNGDGDLVRELVVDGEGTWTVDGTGNVVFTPAEGFTGNPTPIAYAVASASGLIATAEVTVTYLPVAADDESDRNTLGEAVTVDVLGNDSPSLDPTTVRLADEAGDPVTELVVDGEGTWTVNRQTGAITFAPEDGFTGDPTPVKYAAADGRGNPVSATVVVTYTPAVADDASLGNTPGEAVVVDVLGNDSANVDPTTVRLVNGDGDPVTELVVDGEGTWAVDRATGTVTFTPADGFTGDPTPVTYTAATAAGSTATATVTVGYTPVAADDASTGNPLGEPVQVDVLGNDSANLDPSTVRLVNGDGDPVTELVVEGEGTWTVDGATGNVVFTPADGYTGNPAPVAYTAATSSGLEVTAEVTVTYTPAAADDVSTDNTAGKPVTVDVLGNDSANLDPSTVRLVNGDGDPVTELVVDGEGTWAVDPTTGAITFTPEDGFTGDPAPVTYTAADALGNAVTASVTVAYLPVPAPSDPAPAPSDPAPAPSDPAPAPSDPAVAPSDPAVADDGGSLAQTGVMVGGIVGAAALLLALGLVALRVARRRADG
jgi:CshA-type fibril repeat protein